MSLKKPKKTPSLEEAINEETANTKKINIRKIIHSVDIGANVIDITGKIGNFGSLISSGKVTQVADDLIFTESPHICINYCGKKYHGTLKDTPTTLNGSKGKYDFVQDPIINSIPPPTGICIEVEVMDSWGGGGAHNASFWSQATYNALTYLPDAEKNLPTSLTTLAVLDKHSDIKKGLLSGIAYKNLRKSYPIAHNLAINTGIGSITVRSPKKPVDNADAKSIEGILESILGSHHADIENTYILPNSIGDKKYLEAINNATNNAANNSYIPNERFFLALTDSMISALNPAKITTLIQRSSLISMNESELGNLYAKLGTNLSCHHGSLNDKMRELSKMMQEGIVSVTQSNRGAALYADSNFYSLNLEGYPLPVGTVGGGDAYFGAFTQLYAVCKANRWTPNYQKLMEVATEVAQECIQLSGPVGTPRSSFKLKTLDKISDLQQLQQPSQGYAANNSIAPTTNPPCLPSRYSSTTPALTTSPAAAAP